MEQMQDNIIAELNHWDTYWKNYHLPKWEEIPNFGLYMEQVIILMKEYLDFLPSGSKDDPFITAAAVNNYVRTKVMPEPTKKKYYRIHLAYLIMICSLKQSLSIAMIQKLIPVATPEEEMQNIYSAYIQQHASSARFFQYQVEQISSAVMQKQYPEGDIAPQVRDLVTQIALISGFSNLLAEKLLPLTSPVKEGTDK